MADVTVQQFAEVVGISVERLRGQLQQAGLPEKLPEDLINDDEKSQLLGYLRRMHGKDDGSDEPSKITLKRKEPSGKIRNRNSQAKVDCGLRLSNIKKSPAPTA